MFQLGDKTRITFAIIGASCILVSMYLIPLINTDNKFWEILLFIIGVLLIDNRCIANWNCVTKSKK